MYFWGTFKPRYNEPGFRRSLDIKNALMPP